MKFKVGELLKQNLCSDNEIHEHLVIVGKNIEKTRLLLFFERGSMYAFLKLYPVSCSDYA